MVVLNGFDKRVFTLGPLIAIPVAIYMLAVAGLYAFQRQLLYFPDTNRPEPSLVGVPGVEVLQLVAADGIPLLAWYAPPAHKDDFVVLYLHGNAGNIGYRAEHLRRMVAAGWGVLLLEYRGYGGNPGAPSENGLLLDARAGIAALRRNGVAPERTLIWGESLGTGIAVKIAIEQPVAALLLESPYTSVEALARSHFPLVPVGLLLQDRFDSLGRIAAVHVPLLVMQGGRDRIVPPEMGRALADKAGTRAELWQAPLAGHNDLALHGAVEAAVAFVARRLPAR